MERLCFLFQIWKSQYQFNIFLSCYKNYSNKIDQNLKSRFKNTFKFSNGINKFILLLRKFIYLYKFINDLEKLDEPPLSGKEEFYRI